MKILGIETSCDETSIAVVENGFKVLSNKVSSQEKIHSKYHGVVPELASRAHAENLNYLLEAVVKESSSGKIKFNNLRDYLIDNIDLIAYTYGPGLMGSLLVGYVFAKTLSMVLKKPLIPVNHLEGHICSVILSNTQIKPPFISLIISGGHTELLIVRKFFKYEILGRTRDDACGEAFDKVAKLLELKYPGGPEIEKHAGMIKKTTLKFPRPYMENTWDFSFSGLKTAVVYYVRDIKEKNRKLSKKNINDICFAFQESVIDTLINKVFKATKHFKLNKVCISGGVISNKKIREKFLEESRKNKVKVYFPEIKYSTDNAGMIALAGYLRYKTNSILNVEEVNPNAKLI